MKNVVRFCGATRALFFLLVTFELENWLHVVVHLGMFVRSWCFIRQRRCSFVNHVPVRSSFSCKFSCFGNDREVYFWNGMDMKTDILVIPNIHFVHTETWYPQT